MKDWNWRSCSFYYSWNPARNNWQNKWIIERRVIKRNRHVCKSLLYPSHSLKQNNLYRLYKDEIPSNLSESSGIPILEVGSEDVGIGNSLLSEALLSLDEINSSKCIPIGDGKVKCLICERELKRDSWKRHISSVHSNNRPYSCNMCNTTFKVSKMTP